MTTSTFICEKCAGSSYEQFTQTQVRCLNCGAVNTFNTGYKPAQEFQLSLDNNDILDFQTQDNYTPTSLVKRFINYMIDILIIAGISIGVIALLFNADLEDDTGGSYFTLVFYGIFFMYYIIMEYNFGKTVGKFITKTKVVSTDSERLSIGQCIGRAASRFIPFDAMSCLFNEPTCWHDTLPKTMVVDDVY